MDKKVCKHCNNEKNIDEFPKYRGRNGLMSYRNVCKECKRKQEKRSKNKDKSSYKQKENVKTIVTTPKTEKKISNTIHNSNISVNLNNSQKEKLLKLIDNADSIINNIDNKIEISINENRVNRTIRSFNLDDNLYEIIKEKSHSHNISISDFVNLLLKKGLDFF